MSISIQTIENTPQLFLFEWTLQVQFFKNCIEYHTQIEIKLRDNFPRLNFFLIHNNQLSKFFQAWHSPCNLLSREHRNVDFITAQLYNFWIAIWFVFFLPCCIAQIDSLKDAHTTLLFLQQGFLMFNHYSFSLAFQPKKQPHF